MVDAGLTGQTRVDHDADARDGERGLGHRRGEHHPAAPGGGEHGVLHRGGRPAVHLEHVHAVRGQAGQDAGDAGDLTDAGEEAEDVAVPLGQRAADHPGDVGQQGGVDAGAVRRPHRPRRRRPHRVDRVGGAVRLHHGGVVEEPRPALGVGGGRGGDQPQLGAEVLPDVQQEGRRGIGVQMALVAFVQHDGVHPGELLVALQPLQQDAGGDHLDAGAGGDGAVAADRVADRPADVLAQQPGHPAGGGPGGDPARLGHHHLAARPAGRAALVGQPGEGEGDERGLAGSRRRAEDGRAVALQCPREQRQSGSDG